SVLALRNQSKELKGAAFDANANRNPWLTTREAEALPVHFRDNYDNYRAAQGNRLASEEGFTESFAEYVTRAAQAADADGDGIISRAESHALPADLRDNWQLLAERAHVGSADGRAVKDALEALDNDLTLSFFGEDDGGGVAQAIRAAGPFLPLDEGNAFQL